MKRQTEEIPSPLLRDIPEELKAELDGLLERLTGSNDRRNKNYTADQEASDKLLDYAMQEELYPVAFYLYEELVKAVVNHQCAPAAHPGMWRVLSLLKTRIWVSPLMQVPEDIRERYFEYLYYLGRFTKNYFIMPEPEEELEDETKTYLGYCHMMLNTYSCDLPMIRELWRGSPLEVQCPNCGAIITETGESLALCRREYDAKSDNKMQKWDVFHTMMPWLNGCEERELEPFLRSVYGN